jgi:ribonuclease BN (tRNA processing enzyme)
MIENQLKKQGLRLGDIRFVLHTHLHIDHAGKDDLFPMNTTVGINRRELEYSVSGLMHPQRLPSDRQLGSSSPGNQRDSYRNHRISVGRGRALRCSKVLFTDFPLGNPCGHP